MTRRTGRRLGAMLAAMLPAWAWAGALPHGAQAAATAPARARDASSTATCPGATLVPSVGHERAAAAATLCLVDRIRAAHRLRPLRANRELAAVAASQLGAMVRLDYFADVRPSGVSPLALVSATRYTARAVRVSVGQNIAWGGGWYATPASIVAAWMASPPHRRLILAGEYRDAGVAASSVVPALLGAGPVAATYAFEFGARRRAR